LPLGDSITQGDEEHQSYRYPLWKLLIDRECSTDFVGSLSDNHDGNPEWPDYAGETFDSDHEGHWGFETDEIEAELEEWLEGYTFDMVLLHIGTNDLNTTDPEPDPEETVAEVSAVIDILRDANPDAILFVALIITTKWEDRNPYFYEYNDLLVELAEDITTERSPIVLVDHASTVDPEEHITDHVHPNAEGEAIMAQNWFDAIMDTWIEMERL
jgi:lysophospholipase L1-like esterase